MLLLSILFACGTSPQTTEDPPPEAKTEAAAPDAASTDDAATPNPCDLLTTDQIGSALGAGAITQQPKETFKRRHLCAWTWDGGRVDVQVSEAPEAHKEGWSPRMVQAKLAEGMSPEPGLGRTSAYSKASNQIFWESSDRLLFHISAGGDRPGAEIPHESLRALADAVATAAK